jgi:hypothetical protein
MFWGGIVCEVQPPRLVWTERRIAAAARIVGGRSVSEPIVLKQNFFKP